MSNLQFWWVLLAISSQGLMRQLVSMNNGMRKKKKKIHHQKKNVNGRGEVKQQDSINRLNKRMHVERAKDD